MDIACVNSYRMFNSYSEERKRLKDQAFSSFDLMDIACVNSYRIYNMKHPNQLSLLDYKTVVAKKSNSIPSRPEKGKTNVETI